MSTYPSTFIHCPHCDAKVQARVLGEKEYAPDEESEPRKYQFVDCAQCGTAMVGYCEWEQGEEGSQGWGNLSRRWPQVDQQLHANVPRIVRRSLEEAKRCHAAKAYTACAVMVGRAIEGMCKDKVKAKYLSEGLKKLKAEGIIDDKLYQWGEALRNERNIGAHASVESVTWQDASDVMGFAYAMAEYVYVLDEKYKDYVQRKAKEA
jgi:Domain of unknown function (DUF4145)